MLRAFLVCCFIAGINGCVIPTGVSFTALKSSSTTSRGIIKFENVINNEGNGYSASTGKFTAPTDGVYAFSWTIVTRQKEAVDVNLYVNGLLKGKTFSDARDAGTNNMDDSASNTIVVRMRSGQVAEVRVHSSSWNTYVDGGNWSSFSGFRVHM